MPRTSSSKAHRFGQLDGCPAALIVCRALFVFGFGRSFLLAREIQLLARILLEPDTRWLTSPQFKSEILNIYLEF